MQLAGHYTTDAFLGGALMGSASTVPAVVAALSTCAAAGAAHTCEVCAPFVPLAVPHSSLLHAVPLR